MKKFEIDFKYTKNQFRQISEMIELDAEEYAKNKMKTEALKFLVDEFFSVRTEILELDEQKLILDFILMTQEEHDEILKMLGQLKTTFLEPHQILIDMIIEKLTLK